MTIRGSKSRFDSRTNRPAVQRFSDLVSTCRPSVRQTFCRLLCYLLLYVLHLPVAARVQCHCVLRLFTAVVHALCQRLVAVPVATTASIKELLAATSIWVVVEILKGSAAGSRIRFLQALLCKYEKSP